MFDRQQPPLGSMGSSLRRLPRWYQAFSLVAVLLLFFVGNNPIVTEVLNRMHFSLGTEFLWPKNYYNTLSRMVLHERLAFALYSIVIFGVLVGLKKIRGISVNMESSDLSRIIPNSDRLSNVILALALIEIGIAMMEQIHTVFDTSSSQSLILGSDEVSMLQRGSSSIRFHFLAQVQIIVSLGKWWVIHVGLPAVSVLLYRLVADIPRERIAGLRWTLVCFSATRTVFTFLHHIIWVYPAQGQHHGGILTSFPLSFYFLLFSCFVAMGIINHAFGPKGKHGYVHASRRWDIVQYSALNIVRCSVFSMISIFGLLALLVGVHVVELILLWVSVALLMLWIPAALDSFSTDFFTICGVGGGLVYQQIAGENGELGEAVLFGATIISALCACSAVFNTIAFLTRSTRVAVVMIGFPLLFVMFQSIRSPALSVLEDYVGRDKIDTAKYFVMASFRRGLEQLEYIVAAGTITTALCSALTQNIVQKWDYARIRRYSPKGTRVIISFGVIVRKVLHTIVTTVILALSGLVSVLVVLLLIPGAKYFPFVGQVAVSLIIFCTILGVVMDMRDPMLISLLRAVGFSLEEAKGEMQVTQTNDAFSPQREQLGGNREASTPRKDE